MKLIELYLKEIGEEDDDEEIGSFGGANPFDPPASGKVAYTSKPVGSVSMSAPTKKPMAPPSVKHDPSKIGLGGKETAPPPKLSGQKPMYPGSFVGQTASMGRQRVHKNVAWKNKETGTQRYGKVKGWGDPNEWVWDGKDWVKAGSFNTKFPLQRKESFIHETLLRLFEARQPCKQCGTETFMNAYMRNDGTLCKNCAEKFDYKWDPKGAQRWTLPEPTREEFDEMFDGDVEEAAKMYVKRTGKSRSDAFMMLGCDDKRGADNKHESLLRLFEASFPWHKFDEPKMKPGDYEKGSSEFGDPKKARHLPKRPSQQLTGKKKINYQELSDFNEDAWRSFQGEIDFGRKRGDFSSDHRYDPWNWDFEKSSDGTIVATNDYFDMEIKYEKTADGKFRWVWH